jgi:hypothetical protein
MFRYALKLWTPAVASAAVATLLNLALVGLVLFALFPPMIDICSGTHPMDIGMIGEALRDSIFGANYPAGVSFGCHVGSISRLFEAAWSQAPARSELAFAAAALVVAPTVAFIDAYLRTPHKETATTLSGRAVTYGEYARRKIRSFIGARGRGGDGGLWLMPHVRLNPRQEGRNILLLGGHGSGKTGWLRGLIEQILRRPGKAFILDVKGDMIEALPISRFILVAAADLRTWAWDIAADVVNRLQAMEFAVKIIAAADRDPMWGNSARAILTDLIVYLRRQYGSAWGWSELAAIVLSSPAEIKAALVSINARSAVLIKFGGNDEESRTVLSILTTLWVAGLTQILPLAQAWENVPETRRFSVRDWVKPDGKLPSVIVFQKSSEFPELSSAVGAFLIDAIAAFVLSPAQRNANASSYAMILDEFPELGVEAKQIPRLLALGREARVTTVATLQDLGQLTDTYGETRAKLIMARFGIRCVLNLEDGDTTQEVCEKWIKHRELRRERDRTIEELKAGLKKAFETVKEPVIEPSAITDDLGVFESNGRLNIRGLALGFGTVACVDIPMTIWAPRRPAFVPARWLEDDWTA